MNINSIPRLYNSAVLAKGSYNNNKNSTLSQTSNNYVTRLSNYNTALYFHPSFRALSICNTANTLKAQDNSGLYSIQKEDSLEIFPLSQTDCFADKKTNIIGSGSIMGDLFEIKQAYNLFFGNYNNNINLFDPSQKVETPEGYIRLRTFDDVQKGSAFIFSPNTHHAEQVESLSQRKGIEGVYVEKPMCINEKELAHLEEVVKKSDKPLYFGDYFYFAQIAALRLMGVSMPYKESINIEFDKSKNGKFTNSIENATAFFKQDEIESIECKFCEQGADDITQRRWLQERSKGGGVLLDLQVHVFNLLNLMGLELTNIDELKGEKYPYPFSKMLDPDRPNETDPNKKTRGVDFRNISAGEVEDKTTIKGKINQHIDANFIVAQYMKDREDTITIKGKNSQKIRITVNDFDKKVELLNENDIVIARATTNMHAYALMLHHAQTYFNDPKTNSTPMFFDTQKKSLEQIFKIQERLYSEADSPIEKSA